jgi:hypothetical protein
VEANTPDGTTGPGWFSRTTASHMGEYYLADDRFVVMGHAREDRKHMTLRNGLHQISQLGSATARLVSYVRDPCDNSTASQISDELPQSTTTGMPNRSHRLSFAPPSNFDAEDGTSCISASTNARYVDTADTGTVISITHDLLSVSTAHHIGSNKIGRLCSIFWLYCIVF